MATTNDNLPTWQINNGWREILARVFAGMEIKLNLTPEWLINPATQRRLKLDMLYPAIGVAVRFEGAEVKQRRRLSLEEEAQQRVRDDARVEVCRAHGIELILVDLSHETPKPPFRPLTPPSAGLPSGSKRLNCKPNSKRRGLPPQGWLAKSRATANSDCMPTCGKTGSISRSFQPRRLQPNPKSLLALAWRSSTPPSAQAWSFPPPPAATILW
ncbi:MAG: hypothetical protein HC875_12415 [Anaerolineales bacterium]|nr:hypothetical protein [Anaerolineales bacterium]